MHAHWLTAKELVVSPSKFLKKGALVILCSHGGNTGETVEAARLAKEHGAAIITMTHNPESICAREEMNPVVYSWEDDTNEKDRPQGIVMRVLNELLKMQEESYSKYDAVLDGLEKADGIVRAAVKKVKNRTWVFAEKYFEEPFLYIMGSGASYSQAYGFSICSLQEMQWMDCCYLHSGEYFHGPFECTDEDHLYILLMGTGAARTMDERALVFLKKYAKKYEVIDAVELARLVFGADYRLAGKIFRDGREVSIKTAADAVDCGISYLSEDRKGNGLAINLSIEDNIALPNWDEFAQKGILKRRKMRFAAEQAAASVAVKMPSVSGLVRNLSGGNQQKVVIAKWLLKNSEIFIFDEPTRGIDVGAKNEIYKLMEGLIDQGKSIIMISSEMSELLRMSDRILVLCEGRLTGELDIAEATQEKIMEYAVMRSKTS